MPVNKSKLAKFLELAGGALLLLSFGIQNYVYDDWQGRSEILRQAILEQAVIDKSVLLNEALYLAFASGDSSLDASEVADVREQKIRAAAKKMGLSQLIPILFSNDLSTQRKIDLSQNLLRQAELVRDYRSYLAYVALVNQVNQQVKSPAAVLKEIEEVRDEARKIFLGAYLLGGIMLLIGVGLK